MKEPAPVAKGRLRLGQAAFASLYADGILAVLSILTIPYLIRGLGTEPYGILGIVTVLAGQLGVLHFGVGTAATPRGDPVSSIQSPIRAVLEWAVAMEFRIDNPCDRIGPVLGPQHNVVQHMRALPHREVAAAIRTARESTVPLAVRLAFEFLVLTAARWGEVRWAEWTEIDRDEGVWTVPARRMKSNREHRVPLCGRAVEILDEARKLVEGTSPFLFPNRVGKQLEEKQLRRMFRKHGIAAVPHGFRSSFRDWAAEETDHPREVIEAALAHVVQNRVEAA